MPIGMHCINMLGGKTRNGKETKKKSQPYVQYDHLKK